MPPACAKPTDVTPVGFELPAASFGVRVPVMDAPEATEAELIVNVDCASVNTPGVTVTPSVSVTGVLLIEAVIVVVAPAVVPVKFTV